MRFLIKCSTRDSLTYCHILWIQDQFRKTKIVDPSFLSFSDQISMIPQTPSKSYLCNTIVRSQPASILRSNFNVSFQGSMKQLNEAFALIFHTWSSCLFYVGSLWVSNIIPAVLHSLNHVKAKKFPIVGYKVTEIWTSFNRATQVLYKWFLNVF